MSEEKKTPETEQPHQESKRYLVFYVIALFSVALVLILLSYLTQVKADRELATMGVQLQQQVTAVEGAQARTELLQQTVEEQTKQIKQLEDELDDQKARTDEYLERYKAVATLLDAGDMLDQGEYERAQVYLDSLASRYGAERLDGEGEDDLFTAEQAAYYQRMLAVEPPADPVDENP